MKTPWGWSGWEYWWDGVADCGNPGCAVERCHYVRRARALSVAFARYRS